jgi:catecholate siderophore receptor
MKTREKAKKTRLKKGKAGSSWPITYKWVAMGTLVAYSALGSRTITLANAQEPPQSPKSNQPQAQTTSSPRRFDIPPATLDKVLDAFEHAAGLRVLVSDDGIRGLPSPGVSAVCTTDEALQRLLSGTGVSFRFIAPGTVKLDFTPLTQAVRVTAEAPVITSPKYLEPLLDTPQTIGIVSQQVMEEQNATTLRDALRNVAGISLAAGEGGSQGDNLTIRGFTARNDIFLDGMRDFGSYYRDPFNLEDVAVLQGPSSVLFGRGSTGGVVSQETKTPQLRSFITGETEYGTDMTSRVTLDINEPLPQLGANTAFRLNIMGDDAHVADRNVTANRRYGIAPTLGFGIGTSTRITFSFYHQTEDDIPDYGIPWLLNGPAPVDRKNYYGFTHDNFLRTGVNVGTARVEHDINSAITLRNQLRYAHYDRDANITEPQINSTTTDPVTVATPLSQITINRHEIAVNSVETFLQNQTDLTAKFKTGSIQHTLVTGFEIGRETSDPTRLTYTNVPTTSFLDPDPTQPFSGTAAITSVVTTTAFSMGAYVLDTAKIGRKWELTGGVRWDRFAANYLQSVAPISAFARVDEMPSYRAAVVFKPKQYASIYFDYGTSFNPSAESLSLSAATANAPPEKNRTFEVGTKWAIAHERISLGGALFRTDKTNAREPDPDNPLLDVLAGSERVQGVELEESGHLTSRWQMLASYAFLHSEVVNSQYYPASIGFPLANVPKNTFALWSTYDLPWRHMEIGGGENFVGSRTASSTVPLDPTTGLVKEVPGYWAFNAMFKIPLSERVYFQANVYNLANANYIDEVHPAHLVPGAGRTASFSLHFTLPQGKGN